MMTILIQEEEEDHIRGETVQEAEVEAEVIIEDMIDTEDTIPIIIEEEI